MHLTRIKSESAYLFSRVAVQNTQQHVQDDFLLRSNEPSFNFVAPHTLQNIHVVGVELSITSSIEQIYAP